MQTFTEENYLKNIYTLSGEARDWVSTNALADSTLTRAASVTDMLKKLAQKGFIDYQKYRGVRLTHEGERLALRIIRKHRLWEVFLVEKLHFGWDEVHPIAEELEHIKSERLVEKLDAFLGYPQSDPHGDPIPNIDGKMPNTQYLQLSELSLHKTALMMGVAEHSPAFLQHLQKIGLTLGSTVELIESNEYDKSMHLKINNQKPIFISNDVAKQVLVL